jgi:hypothetical protein
MLKRLLFILGMVSLIISCQKQEIEQIQLEYDYGYFPLDSGFWKQYDVTYIEIDAASEFYDTVYYQLREVYSGWFLNAANDSMMRVERFVRDSSNNSWQASTVWQAGIENDDALQIEENIKYLKIKFPLRLDFEWNGDIYNRLDTLEEYKYTLKGMDIPETINQISFDSVLTVSQKSKISKIDKVDYVEKFAYGIGLVEKYEIDVYTTDTDESVSIEQRATKGTMYYQKITHYGKE